MDPLIAGMIGTKVLGTAVDAKNQSDLNREVRKQNAYDRDLSSLQNRINMREYFANQPLTEADRKRKLDEIRRAELMNILNGGVL